MTVVLVLSVVVCVVWLLALTTRRRRIRHAETSVERFDRALAAMAPDDPSGASEPTAHSPERRS